MTTTPPEAPAQQQQPPIVNYWDVDETGIWYLPDGVQYFQYKIMNEGAKQKFEKLTNQDMVVGRDQTAKIKVDPAIQRVTLIETSVIDWKLYMPETEGSKNMIEAKFSSAMLKSWLQVAPPKIVADLEFAIRMANPWMQAEMTVEEVDKELERLYEVRKQVVEREAGEAASANK